MATDGATMLLCDWCGTGWHVKCLTPPLAAVPPGTWICPSCTSGIKAVVAEEKEAAAPTPQDVYVQKLAGPHQQYNGMQPYQQWHHESPDGLGELKWHSGVVTYLGHKGRAPFFRNDFDDGDSTIVNTTALRAIVARMPSPSPTLSSSSNSDNPSDTPSLPPSTSPKRLRSSSTCVRVPKKNVKWPLGLHEPAPTVRRGAHKVVRSLVSQQDVRFNMHGAIAM